MAFESRVSLIFKTFVMLLRSAPCHLGTWPQATLLSDLKAFSALYESLECMRVGMGLGTHIDFLGAPSFVRFHLHT
jgi:hypothetical protein